jgi:hypothetical protein
VLQYVPLLNWASLCAAAARDAQAEQPKTRSFRAGACAVDITPQRFPVLVNGMFHQREATRQQDPIRAKCVVLDDGTTRLAIVVVDSCMMPRELLDRAKVLAHVRAEIPVDHMLIAATHTHSAPAAMGALGCKADAEYAAALPAWIAESIEGAVRNLEPARLGWGVVDDHAHTFCRRWIRRPDRTIEDPFGRRSVRANMHPGHQNPDVVGPSGPVDPGLTLLSVQSASGRPIAVLANYAMHYYGSEPVSADYFGRFAALLTEGIGAQAVDPPFVAIMSQGTSGDQMWMDYGQPRKDSGLENYSQEVSNVAQQVYKSINYHDWVPLAMAETRLVLRRRAPDSARLAWANQIAGQMKARDKDPLPRTLPEVYGQEAIFLNDEPERELKLQAVRIGDLGLTAIPNEVFAITGLKLKARSPFGMTMNIELANGSEGYIPPPEQHALGGYTTWPARTAGLEVEAESKIVATLVTLLERVAGKPRRELRATDGPYAKAVLASRPLAYWRLEEIQGPTARDSTGHGHEAIYQGGVAYFLPGPDARGFSAASSINRAAHFAGGRLKAPLVGMGEEYSVELWFWNGMPNTARPITGWILSREVEDARGEDAHRLGIGGTRSAPGRLFFIHGNESARALTGRTEIVPRTWHHLAVARRREHVDVYLDGHAQPEISGALGSEPARGRIAFLFGGASDGSADFEGKIDEVALYDRALSVQELAGHLRVLKDASEPGPLW